MSDFFKETIKFHSEITNIFFNAEESSFLKTKRALEDEISHFEFVMNRVSDASLRVTLYDSVAAQISSALIALQKVSELQNPVSGKELNDAFQPYRDTATEIINVIERLSPEILNLLNKLATLQKDDIQNITKSLQETKATPVPNEIKEVDPTLEVMSEYVTQLRDDALFYQEAITTIIKAMPVRVFLEMKSMKDGIVSDLERVKLNKLAVIEKKWKLIEASVSTAPSFAGYVIDKILEANNLPTIATEIGLASSAAENFILKNRLEEKMISEIEQYRMETAIILAVFVIPSSALYAARLHAVYKFIADKLIVEYEKRRN